METRKMMAEQQKGMKLRNKLFKPNRDAKVVINTQGKECKMAFGEKANLVASGTIVEIDVPNQLVHNVPLGEGNIRVAVNCALKGDSPLPIPVKRVLETVGDAIGSQVAWPQDLIVLVIKR
ncbi:unnamed protein product [Prunus armeniaca]|uniref:DUF8039 domain-containing protein n=2 Tax=Prunus armeniaca TaxID=36596 RepID=A0A6J5UNZ8_PRUAR|nr:unnamed protein product [Prunus armeniaca]